MTAVIASSLCAASQAAAVTACEAVKPTIEHVALKEITPAGAMFEAQINPQNSATTYEFVIIQQLRNPENPSDRSEPAPEALRAAGGPIPAGAGDVTVSGLVTGLERGYTYWYEVVASNLAGETRFGEDNSFSYYYTGGYPYGIGGAPFRAVPPSPCELELIKQEAERIAARAEAERHQHAREHEEQVAKEDAVRYASEAAALKRREEEEADAEAASHIPSCIVPALKGDTLSTARRAIDKSHCRLGEPHRARGMLMVVGQSHRHGEKLAGGTVIDVTMGPARSRHPRAG
ncbi:MAG TPA: hypothetical protein VFC30_09595 [Solirubrobacteraceae bacterium]|nr:hypothetical protein [Solirubrobacteraceae bacterium]